MKKGESQGKITFDECKMNEGIDVNLLKSGEFKAPCAGTYAFTLHCFTHANGESVEISVMKNNQKEHWFLQSTSNISGSWIFDLEEGDIVHLETPVGKHLEIHFTGHLVKIHD